MPELVPLSLNVKSAPSRFQQGIIAMLAVRLAGDYGRTPDPILMRDADEGKRALDGAFFAVPAQRFESALIHTGQDSNSQYLLGQDSSDYATWAASTDYVVRQHVSYLGNVYECTTAGTSGTDGPSGTSTTVTDGTVTWVWRNATGIITVEG